MSSPDNEFAQLMENLRAGNNDAGQVLFERYGAAIQMVVRQRLLQRMRSEFDSVDFMQDAWASFFRIPPERCTFRTPNDLVAFLTRIVCNKVIDAYRQRFQTTAHDRRKVQSLMPNIHDRADSQPSPSKLVIAEEEWERILHNKPLKLRRALEMLRAGHSRQEIAQSLGVHPKRFQRLLQRLNDRQKRSP